MTSLLTRLLLGAVLLWSTRVSGQTKASLPGTGQELWQWIKLADSARNVTGRFQPQAFGLEARLQAQARALEAILHVKTEILSEALDARINGKNGSDYYPFVELAWVRLMQMNEALALKKVGRIEEFNLWIRDELTVQSVIAQQNPDRVYETVRGYFSQFDPGIFIHIKKAVMREVGAAWFRAERLRYLPNLETLPPEMVVPVFQGFVQAAETADELLALLDRYTGDDGLVINEDQFDGPNSCEALVHAAALADLAKTRAWVEKRYPRGQKRASNSERDWNLIRVRHSLFEVWAEKAAVAAADWLMAQQPDAEDGDTAVSMRLCAIAIAGVDYENVPEVLAWLQKQTRVSDRRKAVAALLTNRPIDASTRHAHGIIARWQALQSVDESEGILSEARIAWTQPAEFFSSWSAFEPSYDDPFLGEVFPEPKIRRSIVAKLALIAGPDSSFKALEWEYQPLSLRAFNLPMLSFGKPLDAETLKRSKELAEQHEEAFNSKNPAERLEGLRAVIRMSESTSDQIRSVMLAHLWKNRYRMTLFAENMLSAWVQRDWRSCEQFVWEARLPVATRDMMLIHVFYEAALLFPDDVLKRLLELIQGKKLDANALNSIGINGSRSADHYDYVGEDIVKALAWGWLHSGEKHAVAMIQRLPAKWQPAACSAMADGFASVESGKIMLGLLTSPDRRPRNKMEELRSLKCGFPRLIWLPAMEVLGRLAAISPNEAKAWLEMNPERMREEDINIFDGVSRVHSEWQKRDPNAADAWLKKAKQDRAAMNTKK